MSYNRHTERVQWIKIRRGLLCGILPLAMLTACAGGNDETATTHAPAQKLIDVLKPAQGSETDTRTIADNRHEQEKDAMTVMVLEELHRFPHAAMPAPVEIEEHREATLPPTQKRFHFGFDRSDVSPEEKGVLQAHADFLMANPDHQLRLTGHADNQGPAAYNHQLAYRRAQSIANHLVASGVNPDQIRIQSRGSDQPLADAGQDADHRRVELEYHSARVASSQ